MKIFVTTIVAFLVATSLSGQSKEINYGIKTYFVSGTYMDWDGHNHQLASLDLAYGLATLGLGWSLPVYDFNKDLTLGVLPSANIGVGFAGSGFAFSAFIPTYLSLRYGAGANDQSDKQVGFGLNFGAQNNFLYIDEVLGPEDEGMFYYLAPEAGVEISLDFGTRSTSFFDNLKLRYSRQIGEKTFSFVTSDDEEYNPVFRQSRLCVIFYTDFR